jgi:hypothetical protein
MAISLAENILLLHYPETYVINEVELRIHEGYEVH